MLSKRSVTDQHTRTRKRNRDTAAEIAHLDIHQIVFKNFDIIGGQGKPPVEHAERPEDSFVQSALSFTLCVGPGAQTRVIRLPRQAPLLDEASHQIGSEMTPRWPSRSASQRAYISGGNGGPSPGWMEGSALS